MWILHAPNVHAGGGAILLREWVQGFIQSGFSKRGKLIVHADARMDRSGLISDQVVWVPVQPTLISRLLAEIELWRWARQNPGSQVCCFGNLPPLLKLPGARVVVYFQNLNLLSVAHRSAVFGEFRFFTRLRLWCERAWLGATLGHADQFWVQTYSTESHLKADFPVVAGKTRVFPFSPISFASSQPKGKPAGQSVPRLVYISPSDPHKNHRTLLDAWRKIKVAMDDRTPELWLSVSQGQVDVWAKEYQLGSSLKFCNRSLYQGLPQLFSEFDALIFPSLYESLGLPLLEARMAGVPILASDRNYVREICQPAALFDPESADSIAQAVRMWVKAGDRQNPPSQPNFAIFSGLQVVDLWLKGN